MSASILISDLDSHPYLVIRIHLLGIRLALTIPEMIPIRRRQSQLDLTVTFLGRDALQVFVLADVRAFPGMTDLANADDGFARDFFFLEESCNVGNIVSENGGIWAVDLFHAIKGRPEGAPEPRSEQSQHLE